MRNRSAWKTLPLRQGIETFRNSGGDAFYPSRLARLAESLAQVGALEEALGTVAEAFEVMQALDEYVHHAELCWLKGSLLLSCPEGRSDEAETCFHQALDVARAHQAKSWELRAATSLARLWQAQGKRQAAYDLLVPVYEWFTEGLDTADLQEAKTLLDALQE